MAVNLRHTDTPLPSDIHVHDPDAQQTSGLTQQDQQLIIGAMSYKDKRYDPGLVSMRHLLATSWHDHVHRVEEVMTPLHECFMLDAALRLDAAAIVAIYKSGFTRIPVYQGRLYEVLAWTRQHTIHT